jgi:RNA polymerase sigma-70 factor (ECF subfamily)
VDLSSLVTAAQAGDRGALEKLLREIRPHLYRYVLSRLVDRGLAEDVTQEVSMTVVAALPRYVDTGRSVLAWVFGIAVRKVSEAHRALRRRPETLLDAVPDGASPANDEPEHAVLALETTREVAGLLDALPAPQGEILRLRVAAGLTAEETASVLGMSAGAVRVAQHRALARLRTAVEAEALR